MIVPGSCLSIICPLFNFKLLTVPGTYSVQVQVTSSVWFCDVAVEFHDAAPAREAHEGRDVSLAACGDRAEGVECEPTVGGAVPATAPSVRVCHHSRVSSRVSG